MPRVPPQWPTKQATKNETLDEGLAERMGLEPATPGVTGRYSNQLNYRSVVGVAALVQLDEFGR